MTELRVELIGGRAWNGEELGVVARWTRKDQPVDAGSCIPAKGIEFSLASFWASYSEAKRCLTGSFAEVSNGIPTWWFFFSRGST